MRGPGAARSWRAARLTPWPGTEGGPAIMLGAWRNKRWIVYAAEQCAGWIASGLYPKPEELEAGIKFYRDAGGKRAVLSNVIIDLHGNAEDMPLGGKASVMLTGGEAAARDNAAAGSGMSALTMCCAWRGRNRSTIWRGCATRWVDRSAGPSLDPIGRHAGGTPAVLCY